MSTQLLEALGRRRMRLCVRKRAGGGHAYVDAPAGVAVPQSDQAVTYQDPAARMVPGTVDGRTMSATFVITALDPDGEPDRDGDVVEPRGCLKWLHRFEANPRVMFNHGAQGPGKGLEEALPIGSARTPDGQLALTVEDTRILSTCFFHGKTRLSAEVFQLVAARELEMASLAFLPRRQECIGAKAVPRRPTRDDFDPTTKSGWRFTEYEILEWSIVPIGSNADALRVRACRGGLCPPLTKALAPYARRRAWSNGIDWPNIAEAVADLDDHLAAIEAALRRPAYRR